MLTWYREHQRAHADGNTSVHRAVDGTSPADKADLRPEWSLTHVPRRGILQATRIPRPSALAQTYFFYLDTFARRRNDHVLTEANRQRTLL